MYAVEFRMYNECAWQTWAVYDTYAEAADNVARRFDVTGKVFYRVVEYT